MTKSQDFPSYNETNKAFNALSILLYFPKLCMFKSIYIQNVHFIHLKLQAADTCAN